MDPSKAEHELETGMELDRESLSLVNGGDKAACDAALAAFKTAGAANQTALAGAWAKNRVTPEYKAAAGELDKRMNAMIDACKFSPGS